MGQTRSLCSALALRAHTQLGLPCQTRGPGVWVQGGGGHVACRELWSVPKADRFTI